MDRKNRETRIGFVVKRLSNMMGRNLTASLKEAGIDEVTAVHGWILRYLSENQEKDVFQKDIEKHFSVGRSSVTNVIQLMEKKGYLCRETVEYDARLKKVVLTEKGRQTNEAIETTIDWLDEQTAEGITNEELEIFLRVTKKVEKNLIRQKEERERKEGGDRCSEHC